MINAAIVGLGWWGKTLVESTHGSDAIRFVAGATRTISPEIEAFVKQHGLRMAANYEALLADPAIDAVVLSTPHSQHAEQVIAAAKAGKHVFCEKPFPLTKKGASDAVAAVRKAGVTLGLGYNRRFHPEMNKLREQVRAGDLGTILHIEATMTFPNALFLKPSHWRAHRNETPAGRLEGVPHVAGASSEERRTRLFGSCKFQPVKGEAKVWQAEMLDLPKVTLEAFAKAASGGPAYPIPVEQMIHGAAVTEAIIRSAASGKVEKVPCSGQ